MIKIKHVPPDISEIQDVQENQHTAALAFRSWWAPYAMALRWTIAGAVVLIAGAEISAAFLRVPWANAPITDVISEIDGIGLGREVALTFAFMLVAMARSLGRGKRHAWWLTLTLLGIALWGAIAQHEPWASFLLLLALCLALLLLAPLFSTRSDPQIAARGYLFLGLGLLLIISSTSLHLLARWRLFGDIDDLARPWVIALHVVAFCALGYGLLAILRPALARRDRRAARHALLARARQVAEQCGRQTMTYFTLTADKTLFWSSTGSSYLAYRVIQGVAVMLGDPIGPLEEHVALLAAFTRYCRRQDWTVAIYQASEECKRIATAQGMMAFKLGEEAIVSLDCFTPAGKIGAPVRHMVARARRAGATVDCWQGVSIPAEVFAGMNEVSAQWLSERQAQRQLRFSMGRFPEDWSPDLLTVVARGADGRVLSFLTWTPLYAANGWALDVMRRGELAPPGVMELMLTEGFAWAKAHGYAHMSLGLAPLAGLAGTPDDADTMELAVSTGAHDAATHLITLIERSAVALHRRGLLLKDYRSLYAFKAKFQPKWEARYLLLNEPQAAAQALAGIALAHGVSWRSIGRNCAGTVSEWGRRGARRLLHTGLAKKPEAANAPETLAS